MSFRWTFRNGSPYDDASSLASSLLEESAHVFRASMAIPLTLLALSVVMATLPSSTLLAQAERVIKPILLADAAKISSGSRSCGPSN